MPKVVSVREMIAGWPLVLASIMATLSPWLAEFVELRLISDYYQPMLIYATTGLAAATVLVTYVLLMRESLKAKRRWLLRSCFAWLTSLLTCFLIPVSLEQEWVLPTVIVDIVNLVHVFSYMLFYCSWSVVLICALLILGANTVRSPVSDMRSENTPNLGSSPITTPPEWDIFISHASEDKEDFVRPLAENLGARNLRVWIDEVNLTVGDSLNRKIAAALSRSRFGVVVISPSFLKKEWPKRELDGLTARENDGSKIILPVWHGVDYKDVEKYSPMLADRLAVKSSRGIDYVVEELLRAVEASRGKVGE